MAVSAEPHPSVLAAVGQFVLGRRLPSSHELRERLSNLGGLAVLASDPLSSVAYATEEMLLVLVLVGIGAIGWSVPLSLAIVGLLAILTPPDWGNVWLAIGFGGLQLGFGVCVPRNHSG